MKALVFPTIRTFLIGALVLGLLLFLPAGTLDYWQAWVFIVVFMTSVNGVGLYLSLKDPALLEKRKKVGPSAEQSPAQKLIISGIIVGMIALFILCALDYRNGWSAVPPVVSLAGDVLVALGLLVDLYVLRENSYSGSTVQTFEEQKVISTGPYGFVRHPMYLGALVMMAGVPLALGSWWGLAVVALLSLLLVWRILDEEKLLKQELPGYADYTRRVRYHLVPYVW